MSCLVSREGYMRAKHNSSITSITLIYCYTEAVGCGRQLEVEGSWIWKAVGGRKRLEVEGGWR